MSYILKEKVAQNIREKYKNSYFEKKLNISQSYMSLILNRHNAIPKTLAYCFTKAVNASYNIKDLFDEVK